MIETAVELFLIFGLICDTRHIDGDNADRSGALAGTEESASFLSKLTQIQAETAVEVLVIPIQYLAVLMRENIYVENFIYKAAADRFSHAIRAVEQMLFYTLEQRVASYLLEESRRLETDTLQVTQEQLAQAIGSAREAGTRTLKKLSAAGRVVPGRCAGPGPEGPGAAGRAGRFVKSQKGM